MLEVVPVVINLLLDVVEGVPGHGLRDERDPEVLFSNKLHEDFHSPEIIRRFVVLLNLRDGDRSVLAIGQFLEDISHGQGLIQEDETL